MNKSAVFSVVLAAAVLLGGGLASAQDFQIQGVCTDTAASASIDDPVTYTCSNETVSATGTWDVTLADEVRLEFYVDGTLFQTEYHPGTWGTWEFEDNASLCNGTHTLSVEACPVVVDGSTTTVCETHCSSTSRDFSVDCTMDVKITGCSWNCDFFTGDCTGTCDATVTGGVTPYEVTWRVEDSNGSTLWTSGTSSTNSTSLTSPTLSCNMNFPSDNAVVSVTDSASNAEKVQTDEDTWPCGMN